MCGISGIASNNISIIDLKSRIIKMTKLLEHRGPDNFSFYINNNIALGHNRLSIIDTTDAGNQPFYNDNCSLAYNGEIYNYLQLKKKLDNKVNWISTSDTEVLFHLLNIQGIEKTLYQLKRKPMPG